MKITKIVILVILTLLSLSAGAVKVMQMPQEVQFFQQAGLNLTLLVVLGVVQIIGGVLLALPRTRTVGAIVVGAGFLASTITIIMTGQVAFGLFSLLPFLLAGFIAIDERKNALALGQ